MSDSQGIPSWVPWSLLFVAVCWLICFGIALAASLGCFGIDKAGQFGDTFGAVNALFTGLALVGLAYTVFLQRQEIAGQTEDAKANKEALQTQSRELYLTARLNATVALLRAQEVRAEAASGLDNPMRKYCLKETERESIRLRQHVGVLLCEANQGFSYSAEASIRDIAARAYVRQFLEELKWRLAEDRGKTELSDVRSNLTIAKEELECMIGTGGIDIPEISNILTNLLGRVTQLDQKAREAFKNSGNGGTYDTASDEYSEPFRADFQAIIDPVLPFFRQG